MQKIKNSFSTTTAAAEQIVNLRNELAARAPSTDVEALIQRIDDQNQNVVRFVLIGPRPSVFISADSPTPFPVELVLSQVNGEYVEANDGFRAPGSHGHIRAESEVSLALYPASSEAIRLAYAKCQGRVPVPRNYVDTERMAAQRFLDKTVDQLEELIIRPTTRIGELYEFIGEHGVDEARIDQIIESQFGSTCHDDFLGLTNAEKGSVNSTLFQILYAMEFNRIVSVSDLSSWDGYDLEPDNANEKGPLRTKTLLSSLFRVASRPTVDMPAVLREFKLWLSSNPKSQFQVAQHNQSRTCSWAICFDIDNTLITSGKTLADFPELRRLLCEFLRLGARLALITGNYSGDQKRRVLDHIAMELEGEQEALSNLILYSSTGGVRIAHEAGKGFRIAGDHNEPFTMSESEVNDMCHVARRELLTLIGARRATTVTSALAEQVEQLHKASAAASSGEESFAQLIDSNEFLKNVYEGFDPDQKADLSGTFSKLAQELESEIASFDPKQLFKVVYLSFPDTKSTAIPFYIEFRDKTTVTIKGPGFLMAKTKEGHCLRGKLRERMSEGFNGFRFDLAGSTSIDVVPRCLTKACAVIDQLRDPTLKPEHVFYFGDEFYETGDERGNDSFLEDVRIPKLNLVNVGNRTAAFATHNLQMRPGILGDEGFLRHRAASVSVLLDGPDGYALGRHAQPPHRSYTIAVFRHGFPLVAISYFPEECEGNRFTISDVFTDPDVGETAVQPMRVYLPTSTTHDQVADQLVNDKLKQIFDSGVDHSDSTGSWQVKLLIDPNSPLTFLRHPKIPIQKIAQHAHVFLRGGRVVCADPGCELEEALFGQTLVGLLERRGVSEGRRGPTLYSYFEWQNNGLPVPIAAVVKFLADVRRNADPEEIESLTIPDTDEGGKMTPPIRPVGSSI